MRLEIQFERPVHLKAAGNATAVQVRWEDHEIWLDTVPTGGAYVFAAAFVGGPLDLQHLLLRAALFAAVAKAPVSGWTLDGRAVEVIFDGGMARIRPLDSVH